MSGCLVVRITEDDDLTSDPEGEKREIRSHPCQMEFNLDGPKRHATPTHSEEKEDQHESTDAMLVLKCHQQFGQTQ